MKRYILLTLLAAPFLAWAAATNDVTTALQYIGNPNASRWNESYPRSVQDLQVYGGNIYLGGGDSGNNKGPCPVFAWYPYLGKFVNEGSINDEMIRFYQIFSDVRLYIPGIDARDVFYRGEFFVRSPTNSTWQQVITSGGTNDVSIHHFNMGEHGDRIFCCGYGICSATNFGLNTPSYRWKIADMKNTYFCDRIFAFLDFGNAFCAADFQSYGWNYYDSATKKFVKSPVFMFTYDENDGTSFTKNMTNTWAQVCPGLTNSDFCYATNNTASYTAYDLIFSHPVRYKNRLCYSIGQMRDNNGILAPWCGYYSAVQTNGVIYAKRDTFFATNEAVYDAMVRSDRLLTLSFWYDASLRTFIWRVAQSTNCTSFTELFRFKMPRLVHSMEYDAGYFYFG